jgi:tetratricopeptide (TPR) repeat protein
MTTLTNSIDFESLMNLYHSGDYERALEAAERLREFGKVSASCCFYRASLLAQLGRLEVSETWFRRSIQLEKRGSKRSLAITLSSLGNLLVQTCRYGEAERQFRKSIRLCPVRSSPYHGMARLCLVRGDDTADAVDWAILALERQEQDLAASSTLRRLNLGECLGTLAWTVAAHWRKAPQVRRLVAQALEAAGTGTVESAALVHYHAGCAYREVGDVRTSAAHWKEAARIDAQGTWGRAAREAAKGNEKPYAARPALPSSKAASLHFSSTDPTYWWWGRDGKRTPGDHSD